MVYTNHVKIKDISTVSPVWHGEEVLILATSFDFNSGNLISPKPKTFQDTSLKTIDTNAGDTEYEENVSDAYYLNNYNRRKSNVSYTGFDNHIININTVYNPDEVGPKTKINNVENTEIFTPSKLMELVLKPRTVYIKDEVLWELLAQPENNSIPAVYGENGIPVILRDWKITPSLEGKEIVMNLTFIEDKGDTTRYAPT